jgi:hypothetical protein
MEIIAVYFKNYTKPINHSVGKNTVDNDVLLGFWRRVDSSVDANVSEKYTVSIFGACIYQRVYTAPKPRRTSSKI